jgi:hypothetical protein
MAVAWQSGFTSTAKESTPDASAGQSALRDGYGHRGSAGRKNPQTARNFRHEIGAECRIADRFLRFSRSHGPLMRVQQMLLPGVMVSATCIATTLEKRLPLPVDALVPKPIFASTHAITIDAPAERVWPWIAQKGRRSSRLVQLARHRQRRYGKCDERTRLLVRGRASSHWLELARARPHDGRRRILIERAYVALAMLPRPLYTALVTAFGVGVWTSAGGKRAVRLVGGLILALAFLGLLWPFAPMHQRDVLAVGEGTPSDTRHQVLGAVTVFLMFLAIGCGATAFGQRFRLYSIVTIVVLLVFGLTFVEAPRLQMNLPTPS